jgi:hypothetical protein
MSRTKYDFNVAEEFGIPVDLVVQLKRLCRQCQTYTEAAKLGHEHPTYEGGRVPKSTHVLAWRIDAETLRNEARRLLRSYPKLSMDWSRYMLCEDDKEAELT